MLWFIVIILAYLLFAVTNLGDKFILVGPPNPKSYAFYVGLSSGLILFLIPFVPFSFPAFYALGLSLLTGVIFVFALLSLFEGLERFESSRIIPAIGALTPLFVFTLVFFFSLGQESLGRLGLFAFILLLCGGIFITYNPQAKIPLKSLKISVLSAFLFALFFMLTKYVYTLMPFWTGFIWIRIGVFGTALFFIFFKQVRREIFEGKFTFTRTTSVFFALNQGVGALASLLQNWAISLAALVYLPLISALQGLQYVFLFIFTLLISLKFPQVLEEKFSKKIILQKVGAILIIGSGLLILALK